MKISRKKVLDFLVRYFRTMDDARVEMLGERFIEHFKIPTFFLKGIEVFGYCPEKHLYECKDDLEAISVILNNFCE